MAEVLEYPGHYKLDGILVVGTSGLRREISSVVQEISIYQSLDTPYMSGSVFVQEAAGLYETLPIIGQERLLFSLHTPGSEHRIDFSDYHAVIYNIATRTPSGNREQSYSLNFVTFKIAVGN